MYEIALFIDFVVDGHFKLLYILAIINNAAMNTFFSACSTSLPKVDTFHLFTLKMFCWV
jgi:hypothetical protein